MDIEIQRYIKEINLMMKKKANVEDELRDYNNKYDEEKLAFERMERESDEKIN